jgi:hypothetical protein
MGGRERVEVSEDDKGFGILRGLKRKIFYYVERALFCTQMDNWG